MNKGRQLPFAAKNLYTRIVRGGEADDIEQWLNREFESPAKEPFQKVLADKELTRGSPKEKR